LLTRLDAAELSRALCLDAGANQEVGCSVDGKTLRGSRRAMATALQVVTAAAIWWKRP
jgi:hypothetical protein